MNEIPKIGPIRELGELVQPRRAESSAPGAGFAGALKEAIRTVDDLQKSGESAQAAFAGGENVELHDVMIKVEEAEIAFRAMMEVRNKLVEAYRDVMRMA